jgi:hypothetical protein
MTAQELEIGYSLGTKWRGGVDANEDNYSEVTGRRPMRRSATPTAQPRQGLFTRGGATNLATKFGKGTKDLLQGSQKNRQLKQRAKIAEAQGMSKALQESAKATPETKKDNTMTYVLVGVGVLAVAGIAFYMIKKGKK